MQDEIMEEFIRELINSITSISEALELVLQHYQVNIAEKEINNK